MINIMSRVRRLNSKVVLLKLFVEELYRLDPMFLRSPNIDEYEPEALSIISRFTECGMYEPITSEMYAGAASIVKQTFDFWFDHVSTGFDSVPVACALLRIFNSEYKDHTTL